LCSTASIKDITLFLEHAKKLISEGHYDFVPRRKNLQSLSAYGLTVCDAKEEILDLKVTDYYKGPKQDFTHPGLVWEFKKDINGIIFYVKIKIVNVNGQDILRCIGFHDDEYA